jgi:3-oxoacyl-[acyl-carrier protein] reductase
MLSETTATINAGNGRLAGKVAIVTGGGRGIGRATAELFATEGAKVLVATRSAAPGREAIAGITAAGGIAALHVVDLSSREAARGTVEAALKAFGHIDILVHNAASTPYAAIADLSDTALDDVLTVNLKTAFWLTAEALPALERSPSPAILVVSSITGNRQWQIGYSAYGASKAGLNSFVRMAAVELGGKGIRVNAVEPGLTLTDAVLGKFPAHEIAKIEKIVPLGATSRPIDIASALLFLASDAAGRVTGQILSVDAGQGLGSS